MRSESQRAADKRYNDKNKKNYTRVVFNMRADEATQIKKAIKDSGMSAADWLRLAIALTIKQKNEDNHKMKIVADGKSYGVSEFSESLAQQIASNENHPNIMAHLLSTEKYKSYKTLIQTNPNKTCLCVYLDVNDNILTYNWQGSNPQIVGERIDVESVEFV